MKKPRRRAALNRVVGAAIDRAVVGAMKRGRYPRRREYRRLATEIGRAHETYRGVLDQPLAFHRSPPRIEHMVRRRGWFPRLPYEWLSFHSGYAPHPSCAARDRWLSYVPNHTGHAWVLRHPDRDRPWLICLHGLGTGTPWLDFPSFRARHLHHVLGLNLLFPVLPLHGPRRSKGMNRGALLSFELIDTLHGMAQAVWDTRQLINWAREEGATRVGLFGLSVGAYAAALVSALEPTDAILAAIPVSDVPSLFRRHSPRSIRRRSRRHGLLGDRMREVFGLVSPSSLTPRAPHAHRYIVAGAADRFATTTQAEMLWEAWERPQILWFDGGHISYFWSRQADAFVDRALATSLDLPYRRTT